MKNYKGIKIDELRNLCKRQGLGTDGKRNDLVTRLQSADVKSDIFSQVAEAELSIKAPESLQINETRNLFLQLKSSNISNYFNFGYFYPIALEESEIYKTENRAKDILTEFEDYLILSKRAINKLENNDVLIELILDGIYVDEYEKSGLFYSYQPIPISRVKSINFKTQAARSTFLSSIKTFPDSFIPSSICKIISAEQEVAEKIEIEKINLPKNDTLPLWKEKLDLFDKILGLLAFMKNAGVIYAEQENKFENYSSGFLGTVKILNPIQQLSEYKENILLKPLIYYRNLDITNAQRYIFKSIIERVYNNEVFDIKRAIQILEIACTSSNLKTEELAEVTQILDMLKNLESLKISYKELLMKEVFRKDKNLPTLALLFLAKFSNKSRQHTDKQAVRNAFIENEFRAPLNITEYVLGFLGLYYGYKNMIKEDTNLKLADPYFEALSAKFQSIKFKLENYFDRFIIESVFQFSDKKNVLNDSFEFLNWNNEESSIKSSSAPPSSKLYEYLDRSFFILGEKILNIIRSDKSDKIFKRIEDQYSEKLESTNYLTAFCIKNFVNKKSEILSLLKKNKGNYSMQELEDVINLDEKRKKQ